jgi:hypothetical protein
LELGEKQVSKKIAVVVTYHYDPDLSDSDYTYEEITSLEGALDFDKKCVEEGELALGDLLEMDSPSKVEWSIVEVPDEEDSDVV